jgi:hypothetical protein
MWLIISNFETALSSEYDLTSFDTRGMKESLLEHAFPHLHAKIAKSFLTITHRSASHAFLGSSLTALKVHKNENFFGFDFEICTFS